MISYCIGQFMALKQFLKKIKDNQSIDFLIQADCIQDMVCRSPSTSKPNQKPFLLMALRQMNLLEISEKGDMLLNYTETDNEVPLSKNLMADQYFQM